jgi:hypothetical protein
MSEIDALRASVPFWDDVSIATAIVLLLGAIGPLILEFTNFVVSPVWKTRIRVTSAVLLIAGTGGQIGAQLRISAISSRIVAILDERAKQLEKDSTQLEKDVEILKADNLEKQKTILELQERQRRQGEQVSSVEIRTRPRTVDADDIALHIRRLKRQTVLTILLLPDPEPHQYGMKLVNALNQSHQVHATVVELKEESYRTGVVVCENPIISGARKISDALKAGGVPNRLVRLKSDQWPDVCGNGESDRRDFFARPLPDLRPGITIFVGHNPQVVR